MKEKLFINFKDPSDIVYWSKKWEISPQQILIAYIETKSNTVTTIKGWLRKFGFAL